MNEALLVLDAQRIYTDKASELYCRDADRTIDNINSLIDLSSLQGKVIVIVRHMHRVDGSDIGRLFDFSGEMEEDFNFKEGSDEVTLDEKLLTPKGATHLIKNRYSAFAGTDLDGILRRERVTRVTICGFMTNFCCESTAREALDRDYYVNFITDATGTPGTDKYSQKEIREIVAELLGAGIAVPLKTKDVLSKWKRG